MEQVVFSVALGTAAALAVLGLCILAARADMRARADRAERAANRILDAERGRIDAERAAVRDGYAALRVDVERLRERLAPPGK